MVIHFVRHGHPNYKDDCLTDIGRKQAECAGKRLRTYGIKEIYASSMGRAMETAEYTAKEIGLEVVPCDFIREIIWAPVAGEELPSNGNPWDLIKLLTAEGVSLHDPDWRTKEPWCKSRVIESYERVSKGLDEFLAKLGYTREGEQYRVTGDDTDKTIAIFSHAGASTAAISHLLNIPFPHACRKLSMKYTSITTFELSNCKGELTSAETICLGDAKHIEGIEVENVFGN